MKVINKSLSKQIVDAIKGKIVNSELKPGQKINLDQLAKECQTSRMSVNVVRHIQHRIEDALQEHLNFLIVCFFGIINII